LGIDRFLQQRRLLFGKQHHAVPDTFWEQPNAVPALGFNGDQSGALTNAYVTFTRPELRQGRSRIVGQFIRLALISAAIVI
jgi:hypothetical protein